MGTKTSIFLELFKKFSLRKWLIYSTQVTLFIFEQTQGVKWTVLSDKTKKEIKEGTRPIFILIFL